MIRVVGLLWLLLPWFAKADTEYRIFEQNGKVGIKDTDGTVVLPATYEALGWSDGSFSVVAGVTGYRSNNAWGIINVSKEFVTSAAYEGLVFAGGDRIVAAKRLSPFTLKKGCLNLNGKVTVPFRYDGIEVTGLRAIVFVKNGTRYEHGLITLSDGSILPMKYKRIIPLGNLRYAVENFDGKIALFTEEGKPLTNFDIDSLSQFHKGLAIVYRDGKQGLIDRSGYVRIEPAYGSIKIEDYKTCLVRPLNQWKFFNSALAEQDAIYADDIEEGGHYFISRKAGKIGLLNQRLEIVVPYDYERLILLENGRIIAKRNGLYGLISTKNKWIISAEYDSLVGGGRFLRARKKVAAASKWLLLDTLGVEKTTRYYDFIGPYTGTLFPAQDGAFYGALDRYGKEAVHCVYDSILDVKGDVLSVRFKGMYGIVTAEERWLVPPQPYEVKIVNEQLYLEKQERITFLKTYNGQTIYFTANTVSIEPDHLSEQLPNGTTHLIDFNGRVIQSIKALEAQQIFNESEGYRGIKRDGKFGFVDQRGRLRIANRYEGISSFREGLAAVKILGKWGFVDKQDHIVINPSYERVEDFNNGTSIVTRAGLQGVLRADGRPLLLVRYHAVARIRNFFLLERDGLKGLAANDGRVIVEPRFDELTVVDDNRILVRQHQLWGLVDTAGINLLPMHFSKLIYIPASNGFLALREPEWEHISIE